MCENFKFRFSKFHVNLVNRTCVTLLKCDRLIYKDLIVHVIKREDLHVKFPPLIASGRP
ncbi:Dual specificity tyrosine-phosphorylation-regulated kinase 2 [Gossypium arboreum]|uniref:Dual specificity tyrosine-phosphorylation-regulated kinase 2 n=1 Tax=Gossypium arboreum TaxID=29729 RepID=A0A0B0PR19_GOSAR|nr:Dual specificity tyrosine-phosphorylation-regulated kinase 2 [Gossypium arboreum]